MSRSFSAAAAHVAHEIAIAYGVVLQLAPQGQIHDVGIEPEAPLALDARIQVKRECHPIVQGVSDGRIDRIFDAGVQQKYPASTLT